ncbi:phosphatase 2C-like domain-containing protein [Syncephalastrum racemosum]|uniref:Phosphatase 2C-like domain-containing protein n=1 Tax=Syncephalastrum racemosum TaxID=13706 RepID=A0A1X2HCZ3_SYNRA|nr:phosphatase 2C-like domain-containing protein [Syncephalastrum racemosum]
MVATRVIVPAVTGVVGLGGAGYYFSKKNPSSSTTSSSSATPTSPAPPAKQDIYDSRPFTLLTPDEIDSRLRSGQFASRTPTVNRVSAIYTTRMASNNPVEDNYSVDLIQDKLIAGVYDGHIGRHCSELIKKQLPIYVARELQQQQDNKVPVETAISNAFETLDADIQQRFYDLFPKNVKHATENNIRDAIARHPNPKAAELIVKEAITGSCACTVYLDGDDLYAANTGDSRVVVIRQEEDGTWTGRRLVEEESPAHPAWRSHMISQHPPNEAEHIVMRNRIFGLIAVGGSFGDIIYKVPREYQMKVFPFLPYDIYNMFARYHHRIVRYYATPPYLYSKPLVAHHKLLKGDRYVVLGTDGLWDELSWDSVRSTDGDQVAAELMSTWPAAGKDGNAATHLMRSALMHDVVYKNVGVHRTASDETLEMSKRLTRQPSRRYRDDITITVIQLKDKDDTAIVREDAGPIQEPEQVAVDTPRLAQPRSNGWFSGIWSRL